MYVSCSKFIQYLYICLFILLCAGSLFLSSHYFVNKETSPKWYAAILASSLLFILYHVDCCLYSGQSLRKIRPYVWGIIALSVVISAIQGILQYSGILSIEGYFPVVGSFDNPAGYAASLCAGFPACLYFVCKQEKRWIKYSAIVVGGIVACAIVLSQSRAGMLSIVIVIGAWGLFQLKEKINRWHIITLGCAFCLLLLGVYFLKKDSADGRLLIWTCSWEMIKDKPLLGHGEGGFHAHYMDYQATYFRQYPDSRYAMLADNTSRPFNEYLLLAIEHGALGFVLLLILPVFLWKAYQKKKIRETNIAVLCLLSVGVFAFFSYPLSYPFPCVMAGISISALLGYLRFKPVIIGGIIIVICLTLCFFTIQDMLLQKDWNQTAKSSLRQQTPETFAQYEQLYFRLCNHRLFLYNYAAELNYAEQYGKSLAIAHGCERLWADYDLQMLIADNYQQTHCYAEAEWHYKRAANMCPVKFKPLYCLFNMYLATGEKDKALIVANRIMSKPVKIMSPTIRQIKHDVGQKMRSL
ncbi:O-antigen ligase family protein [Viscerimonas tarda]